MCRENFRFRPVENAVTSFLLFAFLSGYQKISYAFVLIGTVMADTWKLQCLI